ncbi:MAG: SDR family oxidoreductase [Candidatus Hodarchaeales archaeon]|jgi:dTDP-4-dehydrorhamnose reductase
MKIAITGAEGQIGRELLHYGYEPLKCDITEFEQVQDELHRVKPDVIIHCAALTDVEYCEKKENRSEVFKVNVRGTSHLLHDFYGIIIYLSTVHVFNGQKYWDYNERHRPDPLNMYGFSKWAGEKILDIGTCRPIVVRIARTFSKESLQDTLHNLQDGKSQEFPTFIKRSFNEISHCAEGISWLAEQAHTIPDLKLLNIAGTDTMSYYQFWQWVARIFDLDTNLVMARKHEIDLPPRPFRGGLNTKLAKKLGVPLYSAVDGLEKIKEEIWEKSA